jgi:colicin import membrane protein
MRDRVIAVLLVFGLSSFIVGCKNKEEEAKREAELHSAQVAKEGEEARAKEEARKKAEAEAATKARTDARGKVQKEIDAADRKLAYLKEKLAKATGPKKKNAEAAAAEVTKRRDAAVASAAKLETDTTTPVETERSTAEADVAALNKAIDNLEATLK